MTIYLKRDFLKADRADLVVRYADLEMLRDYLVLDDLCALFEDSDQVWTDDVEVVFETGEEGSCLEYFAEALEEEVKEIILCS